MVGMKKLKNCIIDQVIYYVQGFHKLGSGENDFMHTVIYGPPGTGKTTTIMSLINKDKGNGLEFTLADVPHIYQNFDEATTITFRLYSGPKTGQ